VSSEEVTYFESPYTTFLHDVLVATQNSTQLPDVSHFADHERKHLYKSLTSMSDMTPFNFEKGG
jgi:hypothetical protein